MSCPKECDLPKAACLCCLRSTEPITIDAANLSETERAELNRTIICLGIGDQFFAEQEHATLGWEIGTPPPPSLITGELFKLAEGIEGRQWI